MKEMRHTEKTIEALLADKTAKNPAVRAHMEAVVPGLRHWKSRDEETEDKNSSARP